MHCCSFPPALWVLTLRALPPGCSCCHKQGLFYTVWPVTEHMYPR